MNPAVNNLIFMYGFMDKSVYEIVVCTCAIVHIPPREVATAVSTYIVLGLYSLFVTKRRIPVVISRLETRKMQAG